jgi:hypothetical protein
LNIETRPSKIEDAAVIAGGLRHWDRVEADAVTTLGPEEMLEFQIRHCTECHTLCLDGRPVALFGVLRGDRGVSSVGFLGTDEVRRVPLYMFRWARKWIARWRTAYGTLCNAIHEGNGDSARWLEALGFYFPEGTILISGQRFRIFTTDKEKLVCA